MPSSPSWYCFWIEDCDCFAVVAFLVVGVNAGSWFGVGSNKGKKEQEDYEQTCRHYKKYLFDSNFWSLIDPPTFYGYAQFLNTAYQSGKFDNNDYNKALVASWIELPTLARCTNSNYHKFEVASGKFSFLQNASAYVKYQLDLFEKKCFDLSYQRT